MTCTSRLDVRERPRMSSDRCFSCRRMWHAVSARTARASDGRFRRGTRSEERAPDPCELPGSGVSQPRAAGRVGLYAFCHERQLGWAFWI